MKTRIYTQLTFFVMFALVFAACSQPPVTDTSAVDELVDDSVAGTVEVLGTQLAEEVKLTEEARRQATPTVAIPPVTPTQTSTSTSVPPPQPLAGICDRASYISDITIQDGVSIPPGTPFKKIWAIKNNGTCVWTSEYSLFFLSGDSMGGPSSVPIVKEGEIVAPGDMVLVEVNLVAPIGELKHYRGFWKFRNAYQQEFGWGENADRSIFVDISLANEYIFLDNLCSASWSNGHDLLYCPSKENDAKGYFIRVAEPQMENSLFSSYPALVMVPPPINDGEIIARFSPVMIPEGGIFESFVGCLYGNTLCNVNMRLTYKLEGGNEITIGEWNEIYDGFTSEVVINLGSLGLTGKAVAFTFYVDTNGGPEDDRSFWINPKISQ